jgi:hypothetical protein
MQHRCRHHAIDHRELNRFPTTRLPHDSLPNFLNVWPSSLHFEANDSRLTQRFLKLGHLNSEIGDSNNFFLSSISTILMVAYPARLADLALRARRPREMGFQKK